jgi:hypothetical protein
MGTFFKLQRFALQRSTADFEIHSASRFDQRCGRDCAAALRRCAAELKNTASAAAVAQKHKRCSGTKVCLKNRSKKLENYFFAQFRQGKTRTCCFFSCRCSARHSNPALQRSAAARSGGSKHDCASALQRVPIPVKGAEPVAREYA